MRFIKYFLMACLFSLSCQSQSQSQTITITPKEEFYGIDQEHKIIVWNFKIEDSIKSNSGTLKITFGKDYTFSIAARELSYTKSYDLMHNDTIFKVYNSKLPLIKIVTTLPVKDDPKVSSQFTFAHYDSTKKAIAGIEYRGNISLKFPKKSYDLEFWKNPEEETSIDIKFDDLREDDDWILDGLYNEPLRLRSYFCSKLWLSIHKPYYLDREKDAKSGIDVLFAEVFIDSKYIGIHALTEQVDRKLLQLKKYKKGEVRGELFKAGSYDGAPSYKKVPKYKNLFPHWAGYEMEYPLINYKSHWQDVYRFTKFVIKSKDQLFKKKVSKKFYLDNAIDYFLFINLVRATDNLGKNFYVARYDKHTPYFNIPWDLDGVLGTIQDGKRIPTTDDILSNGLFDRLIEINPDNYRQRLKNRWFTLRKKEFSNESLFRSIQQTYNDFENNKVYERETLVWPSEISLLDHKNYIESWLSNRLQFLDTYFKNY